MWKKCLQDIAIIELKRILNPLHNLLESPIETRNALAQLLHQVALAKANNMLLSNELFIALGTPRIWHIFRVHVFRSIKIQEYYCIATNEDPASYGEIVTLLKRWCFDIEQ